MRDTYTFYFLFVNFLACRRLDPLLSRQQLKIRATRALPTNERAMRRMDYWRRYRRDFRAQPHALSLNKGTGQNAPKLEAGSLHFDLSIYLNSVDTRIGCPPVNVSGPSTASGCIPPPPRLMFKNVSNIMLLIGLGTNRMYPESVG